MSSKFKKAPKGSATESSSSDSPVVIYWFRTDLRLHDSPALVRALELKPKYIYPVWTWDPHYVYRARVGPNRWKFLVECIADASKSLTKLNPKQKLHVIREAPTSVLPKLVDAVKATHLVFEKDTDAYGRGRDEEVIKLLEGKGVEIICVPNGRTLYDPDEVVKKNGGQPTMSMHQLLKAAEGMEVPKPLPAPKNMPDPGPKGRLDLSSLDHLPPENNPDVNEAHRDDSKIGVDKQYTGGIAGPNGDFGVPTLEEMGIDPKKATSPHKGGETEALALLKKYVDNEEYLGTFEKPASAPTDFEPQSTTLLSPHHHFGSLSVRRFYWDTQEVFEKRKKANKKVAVEPVNMIGQLLFRDMYFCAQAALGWKFAQTQANPIAKFIPWHLQSRYSETPNGEHLLDGTYVVDSPEAEEWFKRWKHGMTGFPWIDALMRQLAQEGWIHHLGRHAVACFLTRGGCYVHWERGAEVFEEYLIDHETACNVGNWMWLSCTAFFSQFFRMYSPVAFPKKWDPEGNFVRKYVPELKNFDKKYIYEPHKAPIADQKKWGCHIKADSHGEDGEDGMKTYPKPMFDFAERRNICLDEMKKAYHEGLMGDDKRVISGEWKKIFDYKDGEESHVKDVMSGDVGKGSKRTRDDLEEHENGKRGSASQNGTAGQKSEDESEPNTDEEHKSNEEPPKKASKKNVSTKAPKKGQQKLDTMVTRKKGKT